MNWESLGSEVERADAPPGKATGTESHPEQLTAFASIGRELTAGATPAEGLERAMRVLARRLDARRAAVSVCDPGGRLLTIEAAHGMPIGALRPHLGFGVAGRVVESGRPIVVPTVLREPMALAELTDPGDWHEQPLSLVCVPLQGGGGCVGALSVYFPTEAAATFATRLSAVQAVAGVLAQSLGAQPPPALAPATREPPARAVFEYANMVGASAAMRQLYEEIGQVARTMATALILGESGTGKELVAQAIHTNSDRARGPFVKINGAAFPETLFESELFGHERGAFTGAVGRKKGRLDRAQGGTLFLDEIGDLPLPTQVKLLRVLQFREYERLGGTETLKADVRLIAATNKNMASAVASGAFREDLYYRLNVFTITVPSLRERRGDVPGLAEYFLDKYAREHRRDVRRMASGALDLLCRHAWPGNVRELENALERAVVACGGPVIEERHLPETIRSASPSKVPGPLSLAQAVEHLETQLIQDALRESGGNLARAARALGTTERILRYKADKYGLSPERSRPATTKRAPR